MAIVFGIWFCEEDFGRQCVCLEALVAQGARVEGAAGNSGLLVMQERKSARDCRPAGPQHTVRLCSCEQPSKRICCQNVLEAR